MQIQVVVNSREELLLSSSHMTVIALFNPHHQSTSQYSHQDSEFRHQL